MKPLEIINKSIYKYKPRKVFALFSGGNDSVCSAHIASQADQFDGAVYIDTGIKIQATLDHAKDVADRFVWPFQVVKTIESYDNIVMKHGFPGPAAHRYMYIMLKERAINKLIRENKQERMDRILLITGVRKHESKRRMESVTDAVVRDGAKVWVAPMWDWADDRKSQYMKENKLPENPIKKIMHISGDCLCGAYNQKGDLEILSIFFPEEAERIKKLQNEVMVNFPWTWDDERPPKWFKQYQEGQRFLGDEFMPLCWQCENAFEVER